MSVKLGSMQLHIHPATTLKGIVQVPGSKSHTVRGILLACLAQGTSTLHNVNDCEDTQSALGIARALGAQVHYKESTVQIQSKGLPLQTEQKLFAYNSGITTRFVLPMLGLRAHPETPVALDVAEQMRQRPMTSLAQALNSLGMHIEEPFPLHITGRLKGGEVEVEGKTSQFLSALLLSLPCAKGPSTVRVHNLKERPYIEMTLAWLHRQNLHVQHTQQDDWDVFNLKGGQNYQAFEHSIPGDYSSAASFLALQYFFPDLELKGLDPRDPQADKALVELLAAWPPSIDCTDFPDLLPTLAVVATQKGQPTKLHNVPQARIKETDRIHSMVQGLQAMGIQVDEHPDGLTVYPGQLHGAHIHGFGDHRTIMAFTVAGLLAKGPTTIDTAEGLDKTFPQFPEILRSLGAELSLVVA